jgi:hypothetical protein
VRLLTVFPFVKDRLLHSHLQCLLMLAESIDIILLNTLSAQADRLKFSGLPGVHLARRLRPANMPKVAVEGGNWAMPFKQRLGYPFES